MASPEAPTPATALCGKPAPIVDRFAGEIENHNNPTHPNIQDIQAQRISRLYAVSFALALTISELAFAGCPR
jgi:hypothetical protein